MADVAASWSTIKKVCPALADVDQATSDLPFCGEFRDEYAALCATHAIVSARYAGMEAPENGYYHFDGTLVLPFRPRNLAQGQSI